MLINEDDSSLKHYLMHFCYMALNETQVNYFLRFVYFYLLWGFLMVYLARVSKLKGICSKRSRVFM